MTPAFTDKLCRLSMGFLRQPAIDFDSLLSGTNGQHREALESYRETREAISAFFGLLNDQGITLQEALTTALPEPVTPPWDGPDFEIGSPQATKAHDYIAALKAAKPDWTERGMGNAYSDISLALDHFDIVRKRDKGFVRSMSESGGRMTDGQCQYAHNIARWIKRNQREAA